MRRCVKRLTTDPANGAAARPFRDTRPLPQEIAILCGSNCLAQIFQTDASACGSGLVSRKGCAAAPGSSARH
ncbi:hypothetical protein DMX06_04495 [Pseudomonas mosselii]|nr:hypothetical protein DMX06_04495 [Pseudomonas mosselii]